jgi:NADPH:quinone reductase
MFHLFFPASAPADTAFDPEWRTDPMAKGVRFREVGAPEVLRWESVDVGEPGAGEIRIRHMAVGLNFADTYFRTGLYPAALPAGMGVEAAGVIEAVGPGVTGFAEGDRVTYTGSPLGAYSTERLMDVAPLIRLPDAIPFETAAAMTMRGLTTAYLLRRIADLKAGDTVLLHAAAGGVGLLFTQWAALLGITVIGTVSTDEKAEIARAHGCTHTIVYRREDVAERVRELTDGAGVPVAFDSIGRTTVASSLDSLSRRGLLVCFGTSSGPIPPIDAMELAVKGSLFVTRPALADYIADPAERAALAGELFDHVGSGRITVEINQRYALEDAVAAHRDLESGRTVGSSVFCLDSAAA